MSEFEGFDYSDDSVPRKFYYLDGDVTVDDVYVPLDEERKIFFIKSVLLADTSVLPTTNTSLYNLPQEFPPLFYSRVGTPVVPHVSFLLQGNYDSYEDEIKGRIAILEKENPGCRELEKYKNLDLKFVRAHDALLKSKNIIPVKKHVPSSILLKEYIGNDMLLDNIHDNIIKEKIFDNEIGLTCLKNILDEYKDKSLDRQTVISKLEERNVKITDKFKKNLHECFNNANENSINNIITHRRSDFFDEFVNSFLDTMVFRDTGVDGNYLLKDARMFYKIKNDDSFQNLKKVYFRMTKLNNNKVLEDYENKNFIDAMREIDLIFTNGRIKNLYKSAHIYLLDVLNLKHKQMLLFKKYDNNTKGYSRRAIEGGLVAILLCIDSKFLGGTIRDYLIGKFFDIILAKDKIRTFLLNDINETFFEKTFSAKDINGYVCDLQEKIRFWKKDPLIGWRDPSALSRFDPN